MHKIYVKRYEAKHKQEIANYRRKYYQEHKKEVSEKRKAQYQIRKHDPEFSARLNQYQKRYKSKFQY